MKNDCLIELGTEELPPKALKSLAQDFADLMHQSLIESGLEPTSMEVFATPRRLAMLFRGLATQQPQQCIEKRGPSIKAAFDAEGKASAAGLGFASACGVTIEQLQKRETDTGGWLFFEKTEAGLSLEQLLPKLLHQALSNLPIPKRMRWGSCSDTFVRPVRWLLVMVGSEPVTVRALGVESSAFSYGHKFHAPGRIRITRADSYAQELLEKGRVMVSFEQRQEVIRGLVEQSAQHLGGVALINTALLEEVTALVEYPVVVVGAFEATFLSIPAEVLVMTMQDDQKYFAVFDKNEQLMPQFIAISNIDSKDPERVVRGNERVIRPRFADAQFFFQRDLKHPLSSWRPGLQRVVFQKQLGSIGDKVDRIVILAAAIGKQLGADAALVKCAAERCKSDLMSQMVGEFPKLQGIMGRCYAEREQQPELVCSALEQYYWPRHAGDQLPQSAVAQSLALADRLDSLVGIFAIGQKPSGVKDPFSLRRAALGIVRILIEKQLPLHLAQMCDHAAELLGSQLDTRHCSAAVSAFILDRLRAYYEDQGIRYDIVDAVISRTPGLLSDCHLRILAVAQFQSNASASALVAAHKRISNLLKKQPAEEDAEVNPEQLSDTAEKQLAQQLSSVEQQAGVLFAGGRYREGLEQLASLRPAIDQFFEQVMVMVDDLALRNNRLALLRQLRRCFHQIADFSRIQAL